MNIADAIRERVGDEALDNNPNAVTHWLHRALGNGDGEIGGRIAAVINDLLSLAAVGDIECILAQLAARMPPISRAEGSPRRRVRLVGRRRSRRT